MPRTDEQTTPRAGGRVLMVSTVALGAAAAAVLILGTEDSRLLRLGLVAALWAALLAAFAAARVRRETSSYTDRVDQLRAVYQLELEREVAARREHALTVEREVREQAESSQQREITELRAELAAMGAHLEQLLGGTSQVERVGPRAEPTNVVPLPTGVDLGFGPGHRSGPAWEPAVGKASHGHRRHDVPSAGWSGPHGNGSQHVNVPRSRGSRANGAAVVRAVPDEATQTAQRTVHDLLAAHGEALVPRRRHSHEDAPPAV